MHVDLLGFSFHFQHILCDIFFTACLSIRREKSPLASPVSLKNLKDYLFCEPRRTKLNSCEVGSTKQGENEISWHFQLRTFQRRPPSSIQQTSEIVPLPPAEHNLSRAKKKRSIYFCCHALFLCHVIHQFQHGYFRISALAEMYYFNSHRSEPQFHVNNSVIHSMQLGVLFILCIFLTNLQGALNTRHKE